MIDRDIGGASVQTVNAHDLHASVNVGAAFRGLDRAESGGLWLWGRQGLSLILSETTVSGRPARRASPRSRRAHLVERQGMRSMHSALERADST
jgi:hypothetical protein